MLLTKERQFKHLSDERQAELNERERLLNEILKMFDLP